VKVLLLFIRGREMISALIEALIGSISLSTGLHTKKIDANILYLQQYEWFRMMYEDEKYRKLFITNYKVRSYLQSKLRVRLLVKNKNAQRRFLKLVEEQIEKRHTN
jgi:hypothetical protein